MRGHFRARIIVLLLLMPIYRVEEAKRRTDSPQPDMVCGESCLLDSTKLLELTPDSITMLSQVADCT